MVVLWGSENATAHDYYSGLQKSMHILSMVVYSIACLLGVTGNGLVIWIAGFKMKKTVNSVWFLNLAIADFIFTFFLPLSIAYTALGFHWPFGKLLCKLNSTIAFLNMFASVFLLTVISMDRCVSVAFPVWSHNRRSPELAARIALGTWILALLLSSPYLVFRDTVVSSRNITSCYNNFALSDDYTSECIYTWRPKGRFSSLPLPDFPDSSALLGFHQGAKSGAAALAEYSCAGGVQLRWRCMAALEVYGCAEVYGWVSISAVQRRRRGRGGLFHKPLVIKLVNKIQKSFPMYHSSLVHGLLKLKDKII
uniref:G-protein coupled receptors family 1 profile domain-containing protein n=1 Tax=Buteo japonicus TaxID=224669 RepID=A0A8C0ASC7_9AVES